MTAVLSEAVPRRRGRAPAEEEQSIARVVELLLTSFPDVPETDVRQCVEEVREQFADAPIRLYIPILVARRARAALVDHPRSAARFTLAG